MGTDDSCFLTVFNDIWKKEIASQNLPYTYAIQIEAGNRLRPILMAWGYYLNCNHENNAFVAEYAVSIELLHKASILLDDLIDGDSARHGRDTFHVQYSESEALLYALYMLNRGVELMHEKDIDTEYECTSVLLSIVDNMARGGIKEVSSSNTPLSINDVKEIIEFETISLIKNSFVLGYKLSAPDVLYTPEPIIDIGSSCGYCFQILNDMEPFSAPDINRKYKGNINYDFEKHRKNIVISGLYGGCSPHERKRLVNEPDFEYTCKLIEKYNVLSIFQTVLETEISKIAQQALYIKNSNPQFYTDFKKFLINMFDMCYRKCNLSFKNELFN